MSSLVVKAVAQQLGNLLVEEAKSLFKVRRKIESLQMELEWIECFLQDADAQQHQDKLICKWVSQVRDIAYDGEDITEKYLHEASHHQRDGIWNTLKWASCILCTGDAITLHKLGSELDFLTLRMSELTSRLQRYGVQLIRPTRSLEYNAMMSRDERRTYSHTEEDVVGLDEDIQEVVDRLVKTDVKVVGISGTGGLGKTTLARKVFKHRDIQGHFNDNRAWVYISKEFEKGNIFQEILLGLEKDEYARKRIREKLKVEELPGELHKLLQAKKCLVVIDDIWKVNDWESLKPAFESILLTSTSTSKILLTTRTQNLLSHVDSSGYLHLLKPLSLEDSWELLKRKAFTEQGNTGGESLIPTQNLGGERPTPMQNNIGQNKPQDDDQVEYERKKLEELGREMLTHCDGLPIAIVALGGILSTKKTPIEWENVRENIASYLMTDTEQREGNGRVLKVLELSYHDLPFYLKPCFLYLGNFPEDYKISSHRLYHLWEAEGFLAVEGETKKKRGTTYDIGERYLNELVHRSMIQVGECWRSGRIKACRVHDVMRDMCLTKCEEVSFLNYIECSGSDSVSTMPTISVEIKKMRRCALKNHLGDFVDKHFAHGERVVCLRSLLVFQDGKISPKVWKYLPLLRVLDLEGIKSFSLDGVGHLIHLRYLSLRKSLTFEVPSCLYDLKYLETLDLRCTRWGIMKLHNKFHKMKRLRHLYLPQNFKVEGGEKLKFLVGGQMETVKNFDPERCDTTMLLQMTNLRVFSIRKYYVFKEKEELKRVLGAPVMKNDDQLINSFNIEIGGDLIKEEPMILSSAARHPCFKKLTIERCVNATTDREMGHHPSSSIIIFPERLTEVEITDFEIGEGDVLALEKLPHLKSLLVETATQGNKLSFSPGSFPHLTQLSLVNKYNELRELEFGDAALPNLQIMKLTRFKNLKYIPESLTEVELSKCDQIGEGGFTLLALGKLSHLKSLCLDDLAAVNKFNFSPGSFPVLTQLRLGGRHDLEEWEVEDGALPNLQLLKLSHYKKLNKWNNLPSSLTTVELSGCDMGEVGGGLLLALEKLPRLQQIVLFEPKMRASKMSFSAGSFPQLTQLNLVYLELEELEFGEGALPNLQSLYLSRCDSLKELEFGEGALPNLQILDLYYCNSLKELEVGKGSLPNLQSLYLRFCPKLKSIPSGLPDTVHIECEDPCIKGIEKYNTCPYFNKATACRFKLMSCLHSPLAKKLNASLCRTTTTS